MLEVRSLEEERTILGRHSSVLRGSTAIYSRDLISAPLRSFQKVIEQIRQQLFCPDAGRSGMLTPKPLADAEAPSTPKPGVDQAFADEELMPSAKLEEAMSASPKTAPGFELVEPVEVLDSPDCEMPDLMREPSSDSDEESGDCSSSSSEAEVEVTPSVEERKDGDAPMAVLNMPNFINTSSLVLHAPRKGELFRCGRKITKTYVAVGDMHGCGLRCGKCFAR